MSKRPFNYVDVRRITGNMTSKQIDPDQPIIERAAEFVALEESICYLVAQWLIEQPDFYELTGVALAKCLNNVAELVYRVQIAAGQAVDDLYDFSYGGAGASEPIDETPGRRRHWPWRGNPLDTLPEEEKNGD